MCLWRLHDFLDYLTVEDGTDRLYRNVGKQLPTYAAQRLRRAKTSSTPRRKTDISLILVCYSLTTKKKVAGSSETAPHAKTGDRNKLYEQEMQTKHICLPSLITLPLSNYRLSVKLSLNPTAFGAFAWNIWVCLYVLQKVENEWIFVTFDKVWRLTATIWVVTHS